MSDMSAQALRSSVVNEVIANAEFRSQLGKNVAQAIEAKFGKQPLPVRIVEEQDHEMSLLIPTRTDQLAQTFEQFVKDLGERSPTRGEFEIVLVHRAWSDEAFLADLRGDARAAVSGLLQKYGASVPEGMAVRLYEENAGECLIVVPRPADVHAELTEVELEAVAGGEGVAILVTAAVVGAVATVIADRILADSTFES